MLTEIKELVDLGGTFVIAILLVKIITNDLAHLNSKMDMNNSLLAQMLEVLKGRK